MRWLAALILAVIVAGCGMSDTQRAWCKDNPNAVAKAGEVYDAQGNVTGYLGWDDSCNKAWSAK